MKNTTKLSVLEILKRSRSLLSKPGVWCKKAYAKKGKSKFLFINDEVPSGDCDPLDDYLSEGNITDEVLVKLQEANRFCAVGALYKIGGQNNNAHKARELLDRSAHQYDNKFKISYDVDQMGWVENLNDASVSVNPILKIYDIAIKKAKQDEK